MAALRDCYVGSCCVVCADQLLCCLRRSGGSRRPAADAEHVSDVPPAFGATTATFTTPAAANWPSHSGRGHHELRGGLLRPQLEPWGTHAHAAPGHLIRESGSLVFSRVLNSEKRPMELLIDRNHQKFEISKQFSCAGLYFKRPTNWGLNVERRANTGLNIKISRSELTLLSIAALSQSPLC